MNVYLLLSIAAAVLGIGSVIPYVIDIFYGTTKPNVVSQFLWTIIQAIALTAQLSSGASWSIAILCATTFNALLITVIGLSGYGYRSYGKLDATCFVLAILAIVLWQITGDPVLAIAFTVSADLIATIPTIIKLHHSPRSEPPLAWFLMAVAALCAVFSTQKFDIANLLYPIFLVLQGGIIFLISFIGRMSKPISAVPSPGP